MGSIDLKQSMKLSSSQPNLALHSGAILRQCLNHRTLYEKCLQPEVLDMFFNDFLHSESFDVCSDAFATFRNILTQQKLLVSEFLEQKYDFFFPKYNRLLQSDMQYVTQRQSLKVSSLSAWCPPLHNNVSAAQ